jgi:hypothetical protein
MTQEEIIRMSREAGAIQVDGKTAFYTDNLERFAALVAAHDREKQSISEEAFNWIDANAPMFVREAIANTRSSSTHSDAEYSEVAQPQGEWVDLTDDDISDTYAIWWRQKHVFGSFTHAAIAKFKEKNTPPVVPQGEPVAWMFCLDGCNQVVLDEDSDSVIRHNGTPLVPAPVQPVKQEEAKLPVEPGAWHHPKCDGQCIACLIEKAVEDAYGTQGRDYMLRHINAAPVRTKDLTDDEIMKINVDTASIVPTCDRQFHFARAVIAADRELNK